MSLNYVTTYYTIMMPNSFTNQSVYKIQKNEHYENSMKIVPMQANIEVKSDTIIDRLVTKKFYAKF